MKKTLLIIIFVLIVNSVAFTAYAIKGYLEAEIVDYDIVLNGEKIHLDSPIVTIQDRTYLQLRELCNVLGVDINWLGDEEEIEIFTNDIINSQKRGLTLKNFAFIKTNMEMSDIYRKVGEPSYYTGSGFMWGVYQLDDGTKLHLNDHMTGQLKTVFLELSDGTQVPISFNDNGMLDIAI